ncbi:MULTISPECIES: carbohydrate-binding module family 20 domain-containing protein [Micromonospora]|uniref:Alpha-amylase n=1 Tax=Micromonospora solifontis TaxID=2487138 RepID=A0ABX9WKE5_9ACTN|nr:MULTISPECIES: carbohydrate-binding module family 20 domain-containing protein [Micromonospora]NES14761.1 hypothetical protein [Micromonospora sp. PPF5-17B]NES35325.1 hypothetical protein [Micromonospora solifontis]NES56193.1 hypothetical protein [Micromonospora sp. PPF5-6]RNM00828.1 hypothetical protein EFE23_04000 [Micromonospora solifontis]
MHHRIRSTLPWSSVASECTNVLGPKGFGGVQVSPPQEHVVLPGQNYPWWQDYQPVSYQLVSRRGDRAAFAAMVQTWHGAGVKVYVDAVVNHTAGGASTGPGSAGSIYTHYSYPTVPYGYDDIRSWTDRWEVQNCELVDLADLKTESASVRGNLANLNNLANSMLLSSAQAVAFVDNHDTQRNGRARLTYKDGATQVSCGNGWVCEHRWRTTANLVGFRNAVAGTGVSNWWSNGSSQIAFGRDAKGYVVFNRDGGPLTRTFQTSLPAGTYCDIANGDVNGTTCTGAAYIVSSSGQFTATVPAGGMLALHIGAQMSGGGSGCGTVAVSFAVDAQTVWGENIFVVGNRPELGNWNTSSGVALSAATYPIWRGTVQLPPDVTFEYKYIKKNESGYVIWETGANRVHSTTGSCTVTFNDVWRS